MKNIKSIIEAKKIIEELSKMMQSVPRENIEIVRPICDQKYLDALNNMQVLFNVVIPTETNTDVEIANPIEEESEPEEEDEDEQPVLTEAVSTISPWLEYKPNITWKLDKGAFNERFCKGYMISEEGDIFDLQTNEFIAPFWYDGDMRIKVPADHFELKNVELFQTQRIAPMMCRAFGIKSSLKEPMSFNFKDGDRRHVVPDNLEWVSRTNKRNTREALVVDICQRLVETDGDVSKTILKYAQDRAVSEEAITQIRNKLTDIEISDKYFYIDKKGEFHPGIYVTKSTEELDIEDYYNKTHDKVLTRQMISDKIKRNEKLTKWECKYLVEDKFAEIESRNNGSSKKKKKAKITAEIVVDELRDEFKIAFATDLANQVLNDGRA